MTDSRESDWCDGRVGTWWKEVVRHGARKVNRIIDRSKGDSLKNNDNIGNNR